MSVRHGQNRIGHGRVLSLWPKLCQTPACCVSGIDEKCRESAKNCTRFMQKKVYKTEQMCYNGGNAKER